MSNQNRKPTEKMQFSIRRYHPSDLVSLYRICLMTGDSGRDASRVYRDPDLPGHYYAAPYAVLEPDICFVLTCREKPFGYILGTADSRAFYRRCEKEWFRVLRRCYPLPSQEDTSRDAGIIRLIHKGHQPNKDLRAYPAHLHIDLLPQAQGYGLGRKLVEEFTAALQKKKVPAVHLEVGLTNRGAITFYERVGFVPIKEYEKSIAFGMQLK